jgi:hypothetical protein
MKNQLPLVAAAFLLSGCCLSEACKDENRELLVTRQSTTLVAPPANVTVTFRVDDFDGRGVPGLTVSSFDILEDGNLISTFEAERAILPRPGRFTSYTAVLLDLSGSILKNGSLSTVKQGAVEFVNTVVPSTPSTEVQAGIWWFDGAANLHTLVPFTSSRTALVAGIQSLTESLSNDNSTNLNGALIAGADSVAMRTTADQSLGIASTGAVVLFTDGTDQAGRKTEAEALAKVQGLKNAVNVYTVGLGGEIREESLRNIGKDGSEFAKDLSQLVASFTAVGQRVRDKANSFYVLQYCSPKRAGIHNLRIVARHGRHEGWTETTFNANGFGGGCKPGG